MLRHSSLQNIEVHFRENLALAFRQQMQIPALRNDTVYLCIIALGRPDAVVAEQNANEFHRAGILIQDYFPGQVTHYGKSEEPACSGMI
jgi:hypothetical protein